MGLFGFGKKKEKKAEVTALVTPPAAGKPPVSVDDIPPPEGKPEDLKHNPAPAQPTTVKQWDIPEPRHIDDLEIPAPKTESSSIDTLELPTLEFPTMPSTRQAEPVAVKKTPVAIPEVDKDEETPVTIPKLKELTKEVPADVPKEVPKLQQPTPQIEKQLPLKTKVKTILEAKVEPAIKYEEVPEANVVKEDKGPLFIDMPNFKKLLHTLDDAQANAKNAIQKFQKINDVKNKEDSQIDAFQSSLENAQRKLVFMDKMIFEKQEG